MKLIKRVGLLTMFAFAVAGPVQADVIFKTCAWIEKNGAVLSSAPEGCYIQHEVGKRSLKDRLEAACHARRSGAQAWLVRRRGR